MKYQLLIAIIFIALTIANCSTATSKSKVKSKVKAKAKSKSKKFFSTEKAKSSALIASLAAILAKEKAKKKGDDVINIIPTSTDVSDDTSIVVVEHNPNAAYISSHKDMEFEEMCKIKQGYLAMITSSAIRAKASADGKEHVTINAKTVFTVLNSKTLAVFDNENVDALLKTVDIHELAPAVVPSIWKEDKLHCFELHHVSAGAVGKDQQYAGGAEIPASEITANRVIGFCCNTEEDMIKWVNAIQNFHKCVVQRDNSVVEEGKVDINVKKIQKEFKEREKTSEEMMQMKEERQNELAEAEAEQDRAERLEIEKELGNIRGAYIKEKAKEKMLERSQSERVDQIEAQTKELEEKQQCIREALQAKADEEVISTETEIKREEGASDVAALHNAAQKMTDEGESTAKQIEQKTKEQMEEEFNAQNKLKDLMVEQTMEYEKDMDPMVCVNKGLKDDTENQIKLACGKTVDPGASANIHELQKCLDVNRFCHYCCSYFIGMAHEQKQNSCQMDCNELVHGGQPVNPISMTDDAFIIRVPTRHATKLQPDSETPAVTQANPVTEGAEPVDGRRFLRN